ncbi:MAG: replicative DNA helicase [Acetobacteraceae bacterium]
MTPLALDHVPAPRIPANVQAEQALLGALLANNRAFDRVSEFLTAEHFAEPVHAQIYQAIARRIESGRLADPVTLKAELENSDVLTEAGGAAYLARLVTAMVGIANAADYGRTIYDAWVRRELLGIAEEISSGALGIQNELPALEQIEKAEQSLFRLAVSGKTSNGFISFDRALSGAIAGAQRAFGSAGGVSGLTTGLRDLDSKLGGLHPSDLIIIAGRPGMGKTALATKIAFGAARSVQVGAHEQPGEARRTQQVAVFSLEMSADQLATRLLSEEARISGDRIRRGDIGQKEFDKFVGISRELSSLPMQIDDTPAITMSAVRTRCRRLMRTSGLSLVVIDYLQLMRPSPGTRADSRVLEISQITQGLKALAKELNVPVIALSQLSRSVESREDKRPQLSDLRESGSIEQDADIVIFVYRDEYYLEQRMPKETAFDGGQDKFHSAMEEWQQRMSKAHNRADLIIAKQRHGPTGSVQLFFEAEFTRFADLYDAGEEPMRPDH